MDGWKGYCSVRTNLISDGVGVKCVSIFVIILEPFVFFYINFTLLLPCLRALTRYFLDSHFARTNTAADSGQRWSLAFGLLSVSGRRGFDAFDFHTPTSSGLVFVGLLIGNFDG